jgi:hypothetical protein
MRVPVLIVEVSYVYLTKNTMRKLISCLLVLYSGLTFAQIGEVEKRDEGVVIGTATGRQNGLPVLKKFEVRGEDYYIITYRNADYAQIIDIQSFGFVAAPDELEYLYQFLKDGFDTNEDRFLSVGDARLSTIKSASSIAVYVRRAGQPDGYFYVTKKQLDRLFGKI